MPHKIPKPSRSYWILQILGWIAYGLIGYVTNVRFNCLNNIRALVLEDPVKARDAITKLSDLLRRSITYNQARAVTLGAELDVVRDYLDLESIHMEKRLQYSITIGSGLETFEIPPMSIQLLVENAIKHSLAKRPAGGELSIAVQGSSKCVTIEVANTGQLAAPGAESTGIGLQNIRERLQLLHGASARLTLEQAPDNRVCARICLPR